MGPRQSVWLLPCVVLEAPKHVVLPTLLLILSIGSVIGKAVAVRRIVLLVLSTAG